jgi:hypothetical protein
VSATEFGCSGASANLACRANCADARTADQEEEQAQGVAAPPARYASASVGTAEGSPGERRLWEVLQAYTHDVYHADSGCR